MALDENLTAEEQAQFEAMREADAQPGPEDAAGQTAEPSADAGAGVTPAAQPGGDHPEQRKVNLGALHEERERRKSVEAQLAEERRARQTLEERTNILLQRVGQPQQQSTPAAEEIPPLDKDPVGNIVGTLRQQGASVEQANTAVSNIVQVLQRQAAEQGLRNWAGAHEREFKAENPEYDAAVAHLKAVRDNQLKALGIIDPSARAQQLDIDALQIAEAAYRGKLNYAQTVFEMAKASGFTPKQAAETAAEAVSQAPAEKIATIAAGQQQARSLGSARGSAPAPLNAAKLVNMSQEEFDAFVSKATPAQLREAFGD